MVVVTTVVTPIVLAAAYKWFDKHPKQAKNQEAENKKADT
jgi:hypothetical protein